VTQHAAPGPEVAADNPVLAEVVRSGFVESRHRGAIVAVDTGGATLLRAGLVDVPMFPRSSNKPMQAAAMLRCGLGLDGKLLALAAASHSGEDFHVAGVREILAGAGLTPAALQCPPDLPLDEAAQRRLLRAGGEEADPLWRMPLWQPYRKLLDIGQFINRYVPYYAFLTGKSYVPFDSARRNQTREKRLCNSNGEFISAGNQHRKTSFVVRAVFSPRPIKYCERHQCEQEKAYAAQPNEHSRESELPVEKRNREDCQVGDQTGTQRAPDFSGREKRIFNRYKFLMLRNNSP